MDERTLNELEEFAKRHRRASLDHHQPRRPVIVISVVPMSCRWRFMVDSYSIPQILRAAAISAACSRSHCSILR